MIDSITISFEQYLELLRDMPAPKALPRLLAFTGGSMTEGAIADALELRGKTLDNLLPMLVRDGTVTRSGRTVTLCRPEVAPTRDPEQPRILPEVAPTAPRLETQDSPDSAPNLARGRPDSAPTSGNTVNNTLEPNPSCERGRDVLSSLVLDSSLTTIKPIKPKNSRKEKNFEPPEPKPIARDAMFEAIAIASFGGWEGLTETNAKQIGATKKSLERAGYTPNDVLEIGKYVRKYDLWRNGNITPRVLQDRSTAWRNAPNAPPVQPTRGSKTPSAAENFAALEAAFNQPPTIEVIPHD
jgi:hypothetical protein